jgi:NADH:ubiquinone oxidoreductase subunit 4 (subunit M)
VVAILAILILLTGLFPQWILDMTRSSTEAWLLQIQG